MIIDVNVDIKDRILKLKLRLIFVDCFAKNILQYLLCRHGV